MKKRTTKTSADIRARDSYNKVLLQLVKAFAAEANTEPEPWLHRARAFFKEWGEEESLGERWSEALEPYQVIDGYTCGSGGRSNIHAVVFDDGGNLFIYDGEEFEKVTLKQALERLREMCLAGRMFLGIEPLNDGDGYTGLARWYELLAKSTESAVNLDLSPHTWSALRACAKREGTTVDALVSQSIDQSDAFNEEK